VAQARSESWRSTARSRARTLQVVTSRGTVPPTLLQLSYQIRHQLDARKNYPWLCFSSRTVRANIVGTLRRVITVRLKTSLTSSPPGALSRAAIGRALGFVSVAARLSETGRTDVSA
jgi:hypothetical protein